jgi:hypothetical protein
MVRASDVLAHTAGWRHADFASYIEAVARRLCGEPNKRLSTRRQLRFGTNGSLAVEIGGKNRGTWFDHEAETGGGTLDLIEHRLGLANGAAVEWLGGLTGAGELQRDVSHRHIIATHDYRDERGELLFQVCRFEPKDFRQRRPDGRGGWTWNLTDTRIVPYRLPELIASTGTVYIVEGEKDADRLASLGLTATCNPMGAGKWRGDFRDHLRGRVVVILPDNDDAGRAHTEQVAASLHPVVSRVEILELPDLPPKGDVSDWLAARHTVDELRHLAVFFSRLWEPSEAAQGCAAAEQFDPTLTANQLTAATPKGFATTCTNAIMATKFEPLRWTVPGYVPEGLSILAGRQKLGKTWMAIDFAIAVAIGGVAMGSVECEQGDVLYIDLENGPRRIQRRIATLFPYEQSRPDLSRLGWATDSPQLGAEFLEASELWRKSVEKPALIVVDVLQRIKPAGNVARNSYENDYSMLSDLQQWATGQGVSVLVLHHTRKGGADDPLEALSGSNGLSACADTTLVLDRTSAGLTLYVRGRDVDEKETALDFNAGRWTILGEAAAVRRSDERTQILTVLKDATEPMSPAEIGDVTGMARNNAKQFLFQMAKAGEVQKAGRGRYIHPDRSDLAYPDNPPNHANRLTDRIIIGEGIMADPSRPVSAVGAVSGYLGGDARNNRAGLEPDIPEIGRRIGEALAPDARWRGENEPRSPRLKAAIDSAMAGIDVASAGLTEKKVRELLYEHARERVRELTQSADHG